MRFYCTSMIQLPCSSASILCLVTNTFAPFTQCSCPIVTFTSHSLYCSFYPVLVSYCTFYMTQYYIACSFYPVLVSYCTFYMHSIILLAPFTQCLCHIAPFTWHSIILLLLPSARVLLHLLHDTVLYCLLLLPSARVLLYLLHGTVLYCSY